MKKIIILLILTCAGFMAYAQSDPAPSSPAPSSLLGFRQIVGLDTQHYAFQNDGWVLLAGRSWVNKYFLHLSDSTKYITPDYFNHNTSTANTNYTQMVKDSLLNYSQLTLGLWTFNGGLASNITTKTNGSGQLALYGPEIDATGVAASTGSSINFNRDAALVFNNNGDFIFNLAGTDYFHIGTDGIKRISDGKFTLFAGDVPSFSDTTAFARKTGSSVINIQRSNNGTAFQISSQTYDLYNIQGPGFVRLQNSAGTTHSQLSQTNLEFGNNGFEGQITPSALSANTSWVFQDKSYTIAGVGDNLSAFTNDLHFATSTDTVAFARKSGSSSLYNLNYTAVGSGGNGFFFRGLFNSPHHLHHLQDLQIYILIQMAAKI
jgi:hypothetical protein